MFLRDAFDIADVATAREVVRAHPFATIVGGDLCATHMPCLLDPSDHLIVDGHVAKRDPAAALLGHEALLIFHGPHGYVSGSWYEEPTISTWDHVTLHLRGTLEPHDDPMPLLRRTVDHFEAASERPWSLDEMDEDEAQAMADEVVAFTVRATWWHAEAKLHQDWSDANRRRVADGLEAAGNPALADAVRRAR